MAFKGNNGYYTESQVYQPQDTPASSGNPNNGKPTGTIPKPTKGMTGRKRDIGFAFLVVTVPKILFSAILLGLVYRYQVTPNPITSEDLGMSLDQDSSDVVFVNMSATILVFIASWSSSVALSISGFTMTLFS